MNRSSGRVPSDPKRDLALFQVYRFLSTSYLFAPVLVPFFHSRGLTMTQITLLNSVYCVTAMLFEVPTGVLADRFGRRQAMVLGSLMMAGGCALDWMGHSFAVFAVGEGLLALGMTLTSGADSAWLYDLLLDAGREHEYRRLEGQASAAKFIGASAAMALGGWLGASGLAHTYLVTAFVCLAASLVAAMLRESHVPARRAQVSRQVITSLRTVVDHKPLLFAVLYSALLFTLVRTSAIYLQQPFLSAAGFDLVKVGLLMALLSVGAALGAQRFVWLRRRYGEWALLLALPAVLALSNLTLGRWVASWGVVMLLLQNLVNGVYSPFSKELLNREILDSSRRATVLSVESMVRRLAFGLFAPLCGVLIDARGQSAGFYACAALGVVGTALLGVHVARRRSFFGEGFEGERTPTPLPEMVTQPLAVAAPAMSDTALRAGRK